MTVEEFLPFARPLIGEEEIAEITACLQSGWLTTGPRVARFEKAVAEYVSAPNALCLSSATAGLHLALLGLDLAPGEEVITTPLTFVCTLNTIVQAGGVPKLVDIDPATWNIDVAKLETALTPRTRAIVPVHFAGLPVDLDVIYELAERRNLRVIEDCAHAIGAEYKGRRLGAFGDTQVFSFHPNKNITTGEGGAITTRDVELERFIKIMRFHGIDRDAFNRFAKEGSLHYDVVMPGYKYNMMDIQAALGLHQLGRLDGFIEARKSQAARYDEAFAGLGIEKPQMPAYDHKHAWHLYTILVPETMGRDAFVTEMKVRNIGVGIHYTAAHLFTLFREHYGYKEGDFPIAERVCRRICSLPLGPTLAQGQQDTVISAVKSIFNKG